MEQMNNIYQKLSFIQVNLKAPKGSRNDYGGYSYRSAADILQAVKPLLAATDTALLMTDTIEQVGDRFYVKATATLVSVTDGTKVSAEAMAREAVSRKGMDDAQVTGSSSSYARKYALGALLAIDDSSLDPDTNRYQEMTGMAAERQAVEAQRQAPPAPNAPTAQAQAQMYRQPDPAPAPVQQTVQQYSQPAPEADGIPLPMARKRRVPG